MSSDIRQMKLAVEDIGNVSLINDEKLAWVNGLICFENYYHSPVVFETLVDYIFDNEQLNLGELKEHLSEINMQFSSDESIPFFYKEIQSISSKSAIKELAKKIYSSDESSLNPIFRSITFITTHTRMQFS